MWKSVPGPLAISITLACGCGSNPRHPDQATMTCPVGKALLDGVCVSQKVADYVACVRAQGAQLGTNRSDRLSAEVGAAGVKAGAAHEVSDALRKHYAASDANVAEIIRTCNRLAGLSDDTPPASANAGTPPGPASAATSPPPGTAQPFAIVNRIPGRSEEWPHELYVDFEKGTYREPSLDGTPQQLQSVQVLSHVPGARLSVRVVRKDGYTYTHDIELVDKGAAIRGTWTDSTGQSGTTAGNRK